MPVRLTVIATAGFTAATVIAFVPIAFPPLRPAPEVLSFASGGGPAPAAVQAHRDEPDSDDDESKDDSKDESSNGSGDDDSGDDHSTGRSGEDPAEDDTRDSAASAPGANDQKSNDQKSNAWRSQAARLAAALKGSDDPDAAALADRLAELGITADSPKSEPAPSVGSHAEDGNASGGEKASGRADAPAQLLDMSSWKLTLPGGEEGDPTEILPTDLRSFAQDGIFHLNEEGDGVIFRAEVGGATTKNSHYPRSELREMAGSDEEAAWSNTSGSHALDVREAITEVPPAKPHVVAAQIHDGEDDVLQIRLEGETLAVHYNDGNDQVVIDPAYQLGTPYDLRIVAADSRVVVFYDGQQAADLPLKGTSWYFKVGAYTQSNPEKGDESGSAGEVVVYDLAIDHGGGSGN